MISILNNRRNILIPVSMFVLMLCSTLLNINIARADKIKVLSQETINKLIEHGVHKSVCNKLLSRLREVRVSYYDLDGTLKKDGAIIVLDVLAPYVSNIFADLEAIKFPIAGIDPTAGINRPTAKDIKEGKTKAFPSANYNYTNGYYCTASNATLPEKGTSSRVLGTSIDLNPLFNPYIEINLDDKRITHVFPKDGVFYINRLDKRPSKENRIGMINDDVIKIMSKHGFNIWGGHWDAPIDYQHFQLSKNLAFMLINMDVDDGDRLFKAHVTFNNELTKAGRADIHDIIYYMMLDLYGSDTSKTTDDLLSLYKHNEPKFFRQMEKILENSDANLKKTHKDLDKGSEEGGHEGNYRN